MEELLSVQTIEAFGLMLARTGALVAVAPILGLGTGMGGYKVALVFLVTLVIYVALGQPLPEEVDSVTYAVMMARELLIGAFIGFSLELVLLAVRVGGEMVGQEMGFMVARQVDPITGIQSSLVSNVYENLFLLTLLVLNGHHWLLRSLGSSFEVAPIGKLSLGGGMAETFQGMFSEMFSAGIVFAAPVMIFLVIISVLIGILSRAVTTLNVLELGFTLRVIVSLVAMYCFAPLLEPSMTRLHERFLAWLDRGLGALT